MANPRSQDRALVLVFEGTTPHTSANTTATVRIGGIEPPKIIRVITPSSKHVLKNKILTDPSNIIAATSLSIGGVAVTFPVTPNPGDVLTYVGGGTVTFTPAAAPAFGTPIPYGRDVYSVGTLPANGSAFGAEAAQELTGTAAQTARSTLFGYRAGRYLAHSDVTAIGSNALAEPQIDCSRATVIGVGPPGQQIGAEATVIGNQITSAAPGNVQIGMGTLANGAITSETTAFGAQCLAGGVAGNGISAFGNECSAGGDPSVFISDMSRTTAFGYRALLNNVQAASSDSQRGPTAFGANAGESAYTDDGGTNGQHTLCGYGAGSVAATYASCALGYIAGRYSAGPGNCAMGGYAAMHMTTSQYNTCIGFESGAPNATYTEYNTLIGYLARVNGGAGNVIIGSGSNTAADAVGAIVIGNNIINAPSAKLSIGSPTDPVETTTSVGAAGSANALPAQPHSWLHAVINGVEYVTPLYAPV